MKIRSHLTAVLFLFSAFISLPEPVSAAAKEHAENILVLHSYNQGYLWTDEEMDGINSVLKNNGRDIDLHITYMDAKRVRTPESDLLLEKQLSLKMAKISFDGVIVCDNDALEFARSHRKDLFNDIPVVFCGINEFSPDLISDWPICTGVVENQDYKGACEIGLRLFPSARKVFVISDDTTTGRAHFEGIKKIESQLPGITFIHWNFSSHTISETIRELGALEPDSIILLLSFFRDGNGEGFSMEDAISRVMDVAKVPVFTGNDSRIMFGVLGGKVVVGMDQGACAASMMKKILSGMPVSSIPIEKDIPTRYLFEYQALVDFSIPLSALPSTSIILHNAPPFYSVDKPLFYAILTALVLLATLVLVLAGAILQKRRGGGGPGGERGEIQDAFRTGRGRGGAG